MVGWYGGYMVRVRDGGHCWYDSGGGGHSVSVRVYDWLRLDLVRVGVACMVARANLFSFNLYLFVWYYLITLDFCLFVLLFWFLLQPII